MTKIYKIYVQNAIRPYVTVDRERMESIKADAINAKRSVVVSELPLAVRIDPVFLCDDNNRT